MEKTNVIKAGITAILSFLTSLCGALAVPILLMVLCNIIDYATGLMASSYRKERINSYKSIRGVIKKVCMWLLVVVGAIVDQLILYAGEVLGYKLPFTFSVSCVVAIWIVCSELISILENIVDMGVAIPGFLKPIVQKIRNAAEETAGIEEEKSSNRGGEE